MAPFIVDRFPLRRAFSDIYLLPRLPISKLIGTKSLPKACFRKMFACESWALLSFAWVCESKGATSRLREPVDYWCCSADAMFLFESRGGNFSLELALMRRRP